MEMEPSNYSYYASSERSLRSIMNEHRDFNISIHNGYQNIIASSDAMVESHPWDFESFFDDGDWEADPVLVDDSSDGFETDPSISFNFGSPCIPKADVHALVKKKRIRKPYVPKKKLLLAPRVLRSDLRRQYMNMLTNATNSGDHIHYGDFFRIFGSESPRLKASLVPPAALKSTLGDMMIEGADQFACFLATMYRTTPDIYFQIDNVTFHTVGGSSQCRIECDYVMKGTSILPKWFDDVMAEVRYALSSVELPTSTALSTHDSPERYEEVIELAAVRLREHQPHQVVNIVPIVMKGRFTMFIDENRRVFLIDMTGHC